MLDKEENFLYNIVINKNLEVFYGQSQRSTIFACVLFRVDRKFDNQSQFFEAQRILFENFGVFFPFDFNAWDISFGCVDL